MTNYLMTYIKSRVPAFESGTYTSNYTSRKYVDGGLLEIWLSCYLTVFVLEKKQRLFENQVVLKERFQGRVFPVTLTQTVEGECVCGDL